MGRSERKINHMVFNDYWIFKHYRGGNALKRRRVSSLIKKGGANAFFIQEIKFSNMQDFCAKSF